MFCINFARDWIRTVDLWNRKRPLCQLRYHNHSTIDLFCFCLVCQIQNYFTTKVKFQLTSCRSKVSFHSDHFKLGHIFNTLSPISGAECFNYFSIADATICIWRRLQEVSITKYWYQDWNWRQVRWSGVLWRLRNIARNFYWTWIRKFKSSQNTTNVIILFFKAPQWLLPGSSML